MYESFITDHMLYMNTKTKLLFLSLVMLRTFIFRESIGLKWLKLQLRCHCIDLKMLNIVVALAVADYNLKSRLRKSYCYYCLLISQYAERSRNTCNKTNSTITQHYCDW